MKATKILSNQFSLIIIAEIMTRSCASDVICHLVPVKIYIYIYLNCVIAKFPKLSLSLSLSLFYSLSLSALLFPSFLSSDLLIDAIANTSAAPMVCSALGDWLIS